VGNTCRVQAERRPTARDSPASTGGTNPGRPGLSAGGLEEIGFAGTGFGFDNESHPTQTFVEPYRIASSS